MYYLGARSKERLTGVHPDLVRVVERAISQTPIDFTVVEGRRTLERQKQLVAQGASQTLNSRHITGHAVDLAPLRGGKIDWNNLDDFLTVAEAIHKASRDLKIPIVWGSAWNRILHHHDSAKTAMDAYLADRKKAGAKPFIDMPHFELSKATHP